MSTNTLKKIQTRARHFKPLIGVVIFLILFHHAATQKENKKLERWDNLLTQF